MYPIAEFRHQINHWNLKYTQGAHLKLSLNWITQYRWAGLLTALLLLAVACGGANQTLVKTRSTSESEAAKPGTTPVVAGDSSSPSGTVPELDRSIHSVPLDQITFGTTRARFVP